MTMIPFYAMIFALLLCLQVFPLDTIPENPSAWTEKGTVLSTSSSGWDERGINIKGCVKKDSVYYLYYLSGFNGCWSSGTNHKSLGLATSTDGVNFTKHPNNPLLKPHDFVPVESHEEGIRLVTIDYVSAIAKFMGYFGVEDPGGSNTCGFMASSGCACDIGVDSYIYAAISDDGINWTVQGEVSGAYNESGSENYSSSFEYHNGVYYLWNHRAEGGQIFHASKGTDYRNLTGLGTVPELDFGWSTIETFLHDDGKTVTLVYVPDGNGYNGTELRFATCVLDDITNITNVRKPNFNPSTTNTLLKDTEVGVWRWYYCLGSTVYLRTAPITTGLHTDDIPPLAPTELQKTGSTEHTMTLTWTAPGVASDGDLASSYVIKRNGNDVGTATNTTFSDNGLSESTTYLYAIYTRDDAGNTSLSAATGTFSTLADQTPHTIITVSNTGDLSKVTIVFSEKVDKASAENASNYSIDNGIAVTGAVLGADGKTVVLGTGEHTENREYKLTVNHIADISQAKNMMTPATISYTPSASLEITNLNPSTYIVVARGIGDHIYVDRDYGFAAFWAGYNEGDPVIMTANNDKNSTGASFLSFDVNMDVDVLIGIAGSSPLSWMQGWENTGNTVKGSHGPTYTLYRKAFSKGTVVLGGNEGNGSNMYTVIMSPNSATQIKPMTGRQIEHRFLDVTLDRQVGDQQHFQIRLADAKSYRIQIYNLTGKLLWQYGRRYATTGVHRISWNEKRPLSKTVYVIRLEQGNRQIGKRIIRVR